MDDLNGMWRALASGVLASTLLVLVACGGDEETATDPALSGIVRDPEPQVDQVALPSLTEPGDEVEFRADDGEIDVIYFGFTSCPDVCPTTLADLTAALRMLDDDEAERVEVVMATVDPARDLDVLDDYVTSFIPDAVAVGTDDTDLLEAAAEPFGVTWEVRTAADGEVEVDHTPFLYAVDDQGQLVVTWQFGASAEDIASDLSVLLERASA